MFKNNSNIYINVNILSLLEDLKNKMNFDLLSSACSLRAIKGNSVNYQKKKFFWKFDQNLSILHELVFHYFFFCQMVPSIKAANELKPSQSSQTPVRFPLFSLRFFGLFNVHSQFLWHAERTLIHNINSISKFELLYRF